MLCSVNDAIRISGSHLELCVQTVFEFSLLEPRPRDQFVMQTMTNPNGSLKSAALLRRPLLMAEKQRYWYLSKEGGEHDTVVHNMACQSWLSSRIDGLELAHDVMPLGSLSDDWMA